MGASLFFYYLLTLLAVLVVWAIPAGLVANAARLKGRGWSAFFAIGLATSWLLTSLIVASVSSTRRNTELIPCEVCSERVGRNSSICAHCGSKRVATFEWRDKQVLQRIKAQKYLRLAAIVSGAVVLVTLLILVILPTSYSLVAYNSIEEYTRAYNNLLALRTTTTVLLGISSACLEVSLGGWISRAVGYPTVRDQVDGEPFYTTRQKAQNEKN